MKTIILLLSLTLSAFSQTRPKWLDKKDMWSDSGKVYIKIHVTSNDLDQGMESTFHKFRDVVASNFCPEKQVQCMYFNLTVEKSFWETSGDSGSLSYDIYRLYSIRNIYKFK